MSNTQWARLLFTLTVMVLMVIAQDYEDCIDPKYKKYGREHTMCKYKAMQCQLKQTIEDTNNLNCSVKFKILKLHNYYRNFVASGNLKGQPPAQNMLELKYDENLAVVAQRWSEQCLFEHDTYRTIDPYWHVGQCIGTDWKYNSKSNASFDCIPDFQPSIVFFFEEHKLFNESLVDNYEFHLLTSHYSQIMHAKTSHVGCGFTCYSSYENKMYHSKKLYVYNYGPGGNINQSPVYIRGMPNCKKFNLQQSPRYSGLCVDMSDMSPIVPGCTEE